MPTTIFSTILPNPSPDESQALAVAASYLKRAGTTAATRMLSLTPTPERDLLLESLRDSMLSASELCDSLAGDPDR